MLNFKLILIIFIWRQGCHCAKILNKQEQQALEKFRALVENDLYVPYMRTDAFLLRWIEDRKFDLTAAKTKLLKAIEWRKGNNIDMIHGEENPFLDNYMQYDTTPKDSLGGPIVLIDFGKWDVRRVVLAGKLEQLNRYMIKMMDKLVNQAFEAHKTNPEVSQWFMLANYQGFSLRKQGCLACIPFFLEFISNYENYFTGSARYIVAVNIPRAFDTIGNLIRGAMSPGTQKAFKLLGSNKEEWNYYLDKLIPRDQLPKRFGGTKS